ncbi:Transmembrane secretion effector [Oceanobacillus limi]|uniref:Transmembrane secretion effector n=1 Tax=Oceanobacillus limi TaxID=930131 RepID=A0A1H9XZK1_9BACI|nr:Transmembrane secretion effector [Oceanobacillus limi]
MLFTGRLITNIGDSLYAVAAMWLVYELTSNSIFTGIAGALTMGPMALNFLIGPLVDHLPLKNLLVYSQLIQVVLILIIPITFYLDILNVWIVLTIMPIAVFIEQFAYPAQQTALPKILEKEELVKGNSMMAFAYQGTDIIFIGLSGLIIAYIGAIQVFVIDAFTFLVAGLLFHFLALPKRANEVAQQGMKDTIKSAKSSYTKDLKEGISYVKNSFIPKFLVAVVGANFLFGAVNAILPVYADLRGGEVFYGYYLAALSVGMLVGSLSASALNRFSISTIMIVGSVAAGCSWLASFMVTNSYLSVIMYGLAMIPIGSINVMTQSMLQAIVSEALLGRVVTIVSSMASIALPVGALFGGIAANFIGSEYVFFLGSIANILIGAYWLINADLRKIPTLEKMNPENYGLSA